MNIYINHPQLDSEVWKECEIKKIEISADHNSAVIYVNGISSNKNVNTMIPVKGFSDILNYKEVRSTHGYFRLKIMDKETKDELTTSYMRTF